MGVFLPTGPSPLGVPLESAAAEAVDTSALATRGSLVAAPKVVIDGVGALNLVIPLTAEVGALGEDRGRGGGGRQGERSSAGKGKECRKFHFDDVKEEEVAEKVWNRLWAAKLRKA